MSESPRVDGLRATGRVPALVLTALLLVLLAAMIWVAGALGSRQGELVFDPLWLRELLDATSPALDHGVLVFLRGPRIVAALLVGSALAVAGLILQGITRNPLADPYLLGISGGAGLCVVLLQAIPQLAEQLAWWATPIAAFVGAALANGAVLGLARGVGGRLSVVGLVLAGVVFNAFCAAAMTFLLARFDPFHLRITSTWLYGGIGFIPWPELVGVAVLIAALIVRLRAVAHRLNTFALGSEGAALVGVDSERAMRNAALTASALAALGVALAGLIGYVGLIVPHAVRRAVGHDFRVTLVVAPLAGALLVLVGDTAARLAFAPEELPVGVLTALLGCPVLLLQLRRQLRLRG